MDLTPLVTPVLQLLGTVIAAALTALIVRLLQKVGLSVDADRHAKIEYVAKLAASRAEEFAAAYLKAHGSKLLPTQKLQLAVEDVMARLPRVSREEAQEIVQAVLPGLRLGATAGVAALGKAVASQE